MPGLKDRLPMPATASAGRLSAACPKRGRRVHSGFRRPRVAAPGPRGAGARGQPAPGDREPGGQLRALSRRRCARTRGNAPARGAAAASGWLHRSRVARTPRRSPGPRCRVAGSPGAAREAGRPGPPGSVAAPHGRTAAPQHPAARAAAGRPSRRWRRNGPGANAAATRTSERWYRQASSANASSSPSSRRRTSSLSPATNEPHPAAAPGVCDR